MRRLAYAALGLALGLAACQQPAAPGGPHAATGATVTTDSAGGQRITTFSERFLIARNSEGGGAHPFVIRERSRRTCCFAAEHDMQASFIVERIIAGTDSILWRGEAPFDGGGIEGEFYRGVEEGCCDAPDRYTYISLATGAAAFTLTPQLDHDWAAPVEIDIPNTRLVRYVTFDDRVDLLAPNDTTKPRLFGVLQYGDGRRGARRYAVRSASLPAEIKLGSLRVRADTASGPGEFRMDLWAADGKTDPKAISGAWILVTFENVESERSVAMQIPIAADTLDLRHARLPAGWTVTPIR